MALVVIFPELYFSVWTFTKVYYVDKFDHVDHDHVMLIMFSISLTVFSVIRDGSIICGVKSCSRHSYVPLLLLQLIKFTLKSTRSIIFLFSFLIFVRMSVRYS